MEAAELAVLLENEVDEAWITSTSDRVSEAISKRNTSLLGIVESLGPVLTHKKTQVRCVGLQFFTTVLEKISGEFFNNEELSLLVNFYTDRLRDHHSSIPHTVRGLLYLAKAEKMTKQNYEVLIDRMFRELMVQQQVVRDRSVVFNIIAHILFNRFDVAKSLETQMTVGLLQAGEGEKDPRNLALIFRCTAFILDNLNVHHLAEDIFESLAVYFPIDFTPPKGVNATVTKEDLILGLREGLTHPALTEHSIPLFMEKLDSDLESAKIDSVDSLGELVRRCALVEGGKDAWLADNGKLVNLVWSGIKKELLGIRLQAAETVLVNIRQLITKISYLMELTVGGLSTPALTVSWPLWWALVWKDTRVHLPNPGTRLIAASIDILAAVAGSGKVQSEAVLGSCLPKLLDTWTAANQDARKQLMSSIDQLLAAAAQTGLCDEAGSLAGLSELVTLYLETGQLTGLARAAGLISQKHRRELCESLICQAKESKPCGPALVHLAKWDADVIESRMLPQFQDLGDTGLLPLGDLMDAGFLPQTLRSICERIMRNEYTYAALMTYMRKLAAYALTDADRLQLKKNNGPILKSLLSWPQRPTITVTPQEDRDAYCQVIKKLSALTESKQVLSELGAMDLLNNVAEDSGMLCEAESIISSLPKSVLEQSSDIVEKTLALPGSWELKASLVNKLPSLADTLQLQLSDPQGVGRVCQALLLNGDARFKDWVTILINMLADKDKGCEAAKCFSYLLCPAPWLHASSSLLFKQRAWAAMHPQLITAAKSPENINHLTALVSLLPQVPLPVLEPVVAALLPLVTRALGQASTAAPALSCLVQLLATSPSIIHSHIHDIVPRCLKLCTPPAPLNTRLQALVCLHGLGSISNPVTVSLAETVTEALKDPIKDHKRLVRQEAMRARNRWFLITQP